MAEQYDETVAAHYAAYRPPLHQCILERALIDVGNRSDAVDVGCGTGVSSVALARFCEHVYAIDPSPAMLKAATPHDSITYLRGAGDNLPLPDDSIELATFAGSLFYANSDATTRELIRVCRRGALIVPYDFEVLINKTLQRLGIETHTRDFKYDHGANFSGVSAFTERVVMHELVEFDIRATDLAHILLADSARHGVFVSRYKTANPLTELAAELGAKSQNVIEANIFYSVYEIADDLK
ncbi:MAG: class I SAM-dependent methyltransferase [Pirellulales bacterium]|nr:class I SAM-dependent methyltransferase [Pirellulales bacterium]